MMCLWSDDARFLSSAEATTCHIFALHNTTTHQWLLCHFDGGHAEDISPMLTKIAGASTGLDSVLSRKLT